MIIIIINNKTINFGCNFLITILSKKQEMNFFNKIIIGALKVTNVSISNAVISDIIEHKNLR